MPKIEVKDLTYVYGRGTPFERVAVDGVDFSVEPGEFRGLIGHTGSGKSTLIQHLNGLLKPTEGSIMVKGVDVSAKGKETSRIRKTIGMIFQYPEYQLFEETVFKDI
ncbi:MAG: ATP-binding cassette domain-containing protein, partial [Oscillospiraceae bacterium]|nr:ATP-binding cassette domain-containing protein [Oscillospiraceae bacterium]